MKMRLIRNQCVIITLIRTEITEHNVSFRHLAGHSVLVYRIYRRPVVVVDCFLRVPRHL